MPVAGHGSAAPAGLPAGCPDAPYGIRFNAPGSGKRVALTFDDGPGRDTRQILAVLAANHVTATFFNLGVNEAGDPAAVQAERAGGHALGGHTWDHQSLTDLDAAGQASEIDRERVQQAAITGAYPCLFRPPYGNYDATTLTIAQQRGMAVWYWSVDTEDWKADGSGDAYWVDRITSRAEEGIGQQDPCILMHNQPIGNPATVAALPRIINFYRAHGYAFVDLFGRTHAPAPSVRAVTPASGRTAGGTRVLVTGTGFTHVTGVRFGPLAGRALHVVSATRLWITSPRHAAGVVDTHVVTTHGTSAGHPADQFSYVAPPTVSAIVAPSGPIAGGTRVAVAGTNFRRVATVMFGNAAGTGVHVTSSTGLRVTAPPHPAGVVPVRVTTAYGASALVAADHYTYVGPPEITGVSPAGGPTTGGTRVLVLGADFTHVTAVVFGAAAGVGLHLESATRLWVTAPPGSAGAVDVAVTTRYGTSTVISADQFTYVTPPTIGNVAPYTGPAAGSTTVVVTGTGFVDGATTVTFGGVPGTGLIVNSPTELAVQTPAHAAGTVDLEVRISYGAFAQSPGAFTFS